MNEQDTSNNEKYVLYADIMGFKERVMRTKHEDLKKELKKLRKKLYDSLLPYLEDVKTFRVSFFSDSILIVDEISPLGFYRISSAAIGLMRLSLYHKFPIKGAIAKGEFTYEEEDQLFFGRAIVDAYLLQEEVHYYGIVAHHTMEGDIKRFSNGMQTPDPNDRLLVCPYILSPIPLKKGKTNHYHLAYNLSIDPSYTDEDLIVYCDAGYCDLEQIYGTVSGAPRIYVDNTLWVLEEDLRIYMVTRENMEKLNFPLKASPFGFG